MKKQIARNYLEATARQRISDFLDQDSFREICLPTEGLSSPHLHYFSIPRSFDDGVVVGEGLLGGFKVALIAQEGRFVGGAIGEVHSAKIVGLLRRSLRTKPDALIFLFDSGGVRLQEANAGEIGVAEIIRAIRLWTDCWQLRRIWRGWDHQRLLRSAAGVRGGAHWRVWPRSHRDQHGG